MKTYVKRNEYRVLQNVLLELNRRGEWTTITRALQYYLKYNEETFGGVVDKDIIERIDLLRKMIWELEVKNEIEMEKLKLDEIDYCGPSIAVLEEKERENEGD